MLGIEVALALVEEFFPTDETLFGTLQVASAFVVLVGEFTHTIFTASLSIFE